MYNRKVLSVHDDLEKARLALMTCEGNPMQDWVDSRMLCEVIDRKVTHDPHNLGASEVRQGQHSGL